MEELLLSGSQSDLKICVKGMEFSAHKLILSARSSVFRSMLETNMTEKTSGVVNITDCDADCFKDFLLFLYSGRLDVVSSSNALGLHYIADKYNVEELKKACSECMAHEISVDSFCDVYLLAASCNESELLSAATEFFIENADIILLSPKWLSFSVEHVKLVNELLINMASKCKRNRKKFKRN